MGTHFKNVTMMVACCLGFGLSVGCDLPEGANSHEEITDCENSLDAALEDGCDTGRKCNYEIAKEYCGDGNAPATTAASLCFRQDSGCHTPADPGDEDVRECFAGVIDEYGTDTSAAVRAAADELCEGNAWEPLMVEMFAVMAGAELAGGLESCVEAADDCAAVSGCVDTDSGVDLPDSCE
jgi:hypothetical protein